jgi:hypothetical protein
MIEAFLHTSCNKAAVRLYFHPVPNALLNLFYDRMSNLPEQSLKDQIGNSGRCGFTVTFHGRLILCFIELKHIILLMETTTHSDVIAQVIAEMAGYGHIQSS